MTIKLVDDKRVLLFFIDYQVIKNSQIIYREFKDMCNFSDYFKYKLEKRNELLSNANNKLFMVLNQDSYVYDFKSNEMRVLSLHRLNENHSSGNLIYINYDNSLYCIGGRESQTIERLKLPSKLSPKIYDLSESWQIICSINCNRVYFCSFVVNENILYNLLGYDYETKDYCTNIQKLDISSSMHNLVTVEMKETFSPRLTLASCIKFMENGVYILGGMLNDKERNPNVYIFDASSNIFLKTSLLVKPNQELDASSYFKGEHNMNSMNGNLNAVSCASLNFINESLFVPMKFKIENETNAFFYSMFDSNSFLHLFSLKDFKHLMLFQESENAIYEEDDDSQDASFKDLDSPKSKISEKTENSEKSLNSELINEKSEKEYFSNSNNSKFDNASK
jgi:hypothetical protein